MAILGWDSIDQVTKIHRFFEVAGIVCLAALVLTETIAVIYSRRKDALIEGIDAKRGEEQQAKERDLTTKLDRAAEDARQAKESQASAEKELSKLRANANPRTISGVGRDQLIQQLAQHPGYIAELSAVPDAEAMQLSRKIVDVLGAAKWTIGTYSQMSTTTGQGLIYSVPDPQHPSASERALIDGLRKAGLRVTVNTGHGDLLIGFRVPE